MEFEPEYCIAECDCGWKGSKQETERAARQEKVEHKRAHEQHNPFVMRIFDSKPKTVV